MLMMICGALLIGVVVGTAIGTLHGAAARGTLPRAFGSDRPAAFIENAVAIRVGIAVVFPS
jgi:uncharacterized membrane protein